MLEGYIAGKFADKMFEKDIFQIVRNHAIFGAIIMMIPDFGFGTLFFVGVLWHMYSSICNKVGISFSGNFWSLVGVGIFVNIIIALAIDVIFSFLFFLEGFIMYFQFYMSGKLFVESVKQLDVYNEVEEEQEEQKRALPPIPEKIDIPQEPNKLLTVKSLDSPKENLNNLIGLLDAGILTSEEFAELEKLEEKKLQDDNKPQAEIKVENNKIDLLRNLKLLLDSEILSPEEYRIQKNSILYLSSIPMWKDDKTKFETLIELKSLLDEGVLTQKDFDFYKKLLLNAE